MTPPTILFVSPDASQTGAPILLLRFLRWFRNNRGAPFRVLFRRTGPLLPAFEELAPVDIFEPKPPLPWRIARRMGWNHTPDYSRHHASLRERLLAANIGAVYSNTIVNGPILDFLAFLECPVVCHVHELDYVVQYAGPRNLESVKAATSTYVAVSDAVKRNLVQTCSIPEPDIHLIHGFLDTESNRTEIADQQRRRTLEELGCPQDSHLVCGCGSIEPRKGTDLFLDVAAQVAAESVQPVRFVWLGGRSDQVRKMRSKARALGLGGIVHFTGHRDNVRPYFAASDVFLLTSREDPFPLVMLEAALERTPIICFGNSGGAQEFVRNDAGVVLPDVSVSMMAHSLLELLGAADARERMGMVARRRVLSEHDTQIVAPKIAAIVEQALSVPRTRRKVRTL